MKINFTALSLFISILSFSQGINTMERNDAGQNTDPKSGFYQTYQPVNYPPGAINGHWWHLLDVKHQDLTYNFAMQFSGNFSDQNLFFRKTANNPAQPWSKVLMENPEGKVVIGVGSTNWSKFTLNGSHTNTSLLMHADNGTYPNAYLSLWASEPNSHWNSVGIGNNVRNYDGSATFTRIDNTKGSSFIRLVDTEINFNLISEAGAQVTPFVIRPNNAMFQGKLEAKEVKVTLTPTADFVFEEDYNLPKLEEVEKHIKEKKHLPEIASAKEMEKEGLNVGEFQIKLLQKIEELTLYSIEQNKRIKKLEEELLINRKK